MKNIRIIAGLGLVMALAIGITVYFTTSTETAVAYKTHDDLLKDIGLRTPEFGGMYLSEDNNTLYVYLTDKTQNPQKRQEVRESIKDVLKDDLTKGKNIKIVPAQYSMSQLYDWYRQMMPMFENSQVTMTDLQESRNRIEIGVDDLGVIPTLEAKLTQLNIPRESVIFSEVEFAVPLYHTLSDSAPDGELEGGYRIARSISDTEEAQCTLGFNTDRDGDEGFVTAGHCTEGGKGTYWDGGVDNGGADFYQPDSSSNSNLVGQETEDPDLTSSETGCPQGDICRRSDSAFITLDSGVSQNIGRIAKTTGLGSTTVDHTSGYSITSDGHSVAVNTGVHFVGATSGLQGGRVQSTCTRAFYTNDRTMLCQNLVKNTSADHGDSGAPVFRITDYPDTGDVDLLGIVVAKSGSSKYYYSPIGNIYDELGDASDTWDSCDSSHNC